MEETTYEIMFYDQNQVVEQSFQISGIEQETVKSYDTFVLGKDGEVTISDLPVQTVVKITPIIIAPHYTAEALVYETTIKAGENRLSAENKVNPNKWTGFYPYVKTIFDKELPKGAKVKYRLELVSDTAGEFDEFTPLELESEKCGSDLFSYIRFEKAGTYVFKIKAVESNVAGLELEDKEAQVQAEVTSIREGFGLELNYTTSPVFTHHYQYPETTFAPQAKKELVGESPNRDRFEFTLSQDDQQTGSRLPEQKSITLEGGKSGQFDPITFSLPGEYSFTISEKVADIPGYTFDQKSWQLKLTVVSKLEGLSVTETNYTRATEKNECAEFTNIYESGTLKIIKRVENTKDSRSYQITLALKDNQNRALSGVYPYTSSVNSKSGTVRDGEVIEISADEEITITKLPVGAQYSVTENVPPGFILTCENSTGEITKTQTVVTLQNSYEPTPVDYLPTISKKITGERVSEETFHFRVELIEGDIQDVSVPTDLYSVTGEGVASGNSIKFLRDGTFGFKITEVDESFPGYKNDTNSYKLRVRVDTHDGALNIVSTEYECAGQTYEQAEFNNTYYSGCLTISKEVTGIQTEDTFSFLVRFQNDDRELEELFPAQYSTGENTQVRSGERVVLASGETITIRALPIGTKYEVEETDIPKGYTVSPKLERGSIGTGEKKAAFINAYTYDPVSFTPSVEKSIQGKSDTTDSFNFVLNADPGNDENDPLNRTLKTTVQGPGSADFSELSFTTTGEYRYLITEVDANNVSYVKDQSTWELEVIVSDPGNGQLQLNRRYKRIEDNRLEERAVFTNTYAPERVEYRIAVSKTVTGDAPNTDSYSFLLTPGEEYESVYMPSMNTVEITGEGSAEFSPVVFTEAGEYYFWVQEVDTGNPGYIYDKNAYKVTITISDQLTVEDVDYQLSETAKSMSIAGFTNQYTGGSLEVSKTVPGGSDERFNFTLELTDAKGSPITGAYTYRGSHEGEIKTGEQFTLGDGEHVEILELPAGANYRIIEEENARFQVQASGDTGKIMEKTRSYAVFTNTPITEAVVQVPTNSDPMSAEVQQVSLPKTGDERQTLIWIGIFLLSAIGIVILIRIRVRGLIFKPRTKKMDHSVNDHQDD